MPVHFTPHTEADARKVSTRTLLKAGWCDVARIIEAAEKLSKSGKPMIELTVSIPDAEGNERQLRDWIVPSSKFHALKFRHACEAVGALAQYQDGTIAAEDFVAANIEVRVELAVTRRNGYSGNSIEDYAPVKSSVVNLRSA